MKPKTKEAAEPYYKTHHCSIIRIGTYVGDILVRLFFSLWFCHYNDNSNYYY